MRRFNDTLVEFIDEYTGEVISFNKVTVHTDGGAMTDAKCDGIIYRKLGAEYFKRNFVTNINVKWFGARGDGLGATPTDDGVDILAASWNVWPSYIVNGDEYSPYKTDGINFNPPTVKPFSNTDSWDFIGIQRAIWASQRMALPSSIHVPKGVYLTTKEILFANHFSGSFYGDGVFGTTIQGKTGHTTGLNVLRIYRLGGSPSMFRDMQICAPSGGGVLDMTLLLLENTNGARFRSLWVQGAVNAGHTGSNDNSGFRFSYQCSDIFIDEITMEYCDTFIRLDGANDLTIHDCNFWQSAAGIPCRGVVAPAADIQVYNSRFKGFVGVALDLSSTSGSSVSQGNQITGQGGSIGATIANCLFQNNLLQGSVGSSLLSAQNNCHISTNKFIQGDKSHPAVDFVYNGGDYCRGCLFNNNIVISPDNTLPIGSQIPGSSYTGSLKDSILVGNLIKASAIGGISEVDNLLGNNKTI